MRNEWTVYIEPTLVCRVMLLQSRETKTQSGEDNAALPRRWLDAESRGPFYGGTREEEEAGCHHPGLPGKASSAGLMCEYLLPVAIGSLSGPIIFQPSQNTSI